MGVAGAAGSTVELPHGTSVTYSTAGRRLLERDRHGHDLARLSWRDDGTLASAAVQLPDHSWLTIEPRAVSDAPWGLSDRLWHQDAPLTIFAALDYAKIAFIPPLADPARLPPGGGTAVLNVLAGLAADQGCGRLMYQGPYASEQLFLALLESFRYDSGGDDPLQAFMTGTLSWTPAPHERVLTHAGAWVQLRERIEKVMWAGRAYYRPAWQGVLRQTEQRVRDVDDGAICSLWALDGPIEDHLRMDARGDGVTILAVEPPEPAVTPAPAGVLTGLAVVVAARSAPVLGPFIVQAAAEMTFEWAPLTGTLVAVHDDRLLLSNRLLPAMDARRATASTQEERAGIAIAVLAELAHLAGDGLRERAQRRLAALPEAEQAAILEADRGLADGDVARAIGAAVRALLAWRAPTRSRAG